MNILHISPDFNYSCGVSKYIYLLLQEFSNNPSYKLFFITNGGDSLDRLNSLNVEVHLMKFSTGLINVFNFYSNYRKLKEFCIKNKIDIIHTHHRYPELLAHYVSRKSNIKTITTVHSLLNSYKSLSFKSDEIIAVSNAVKNNIISNYDIPENKIEVMYNLIDEKYFNQNIISMNKDILENDILKLKNQFYIPLNNKVIFFAGRINKIKGIDILINAFKKLNKEYSNLSLLLIGEILDAQFNEKNLKQIPNIIYLQPQKDIDIFYYLSDIIVLPSRVESFPLIMLEAGIFQKPFIGSKTGGVAEFIEHNHQGLLFESENVNELSNTIKYLLNNEEEGNRLAKNLNEKVKRFCNSSDYIQRLNNIYDSLYNSK
ncbi:MAG: glycosyltransferase family 4 protein [Ignavibacterium sp.]